MASTYSANLRLELIGTGEQQGTWGSTTNSNLGTLLEQAIGGHESITVLDVGDTTLTTADGVSDQARNMTLTLTGAISAPRNVICPAIEKIYIVKNGTSNGHAVTFKATGAGKTGVSIPNGATYILYVDGTDARQASGSVASGGTGASTAADAATNLGLGTGDSPQFAGVNVGNASDTTITRVSAGVIAVEGNKVVTEDASGNAAITGVVVQSSSFLRNRIINGDMRIDQRNAGASVTPANLAYTLDRWNVNSSPTGKFSVQRNAGAVTPPSGFTHYQGITSLSAYTVAAGDLIGITQAIEGLNVADLDFGKATAKPVTLGFWVRSSLTGTFGGAILNGTATRSYPFSYTISAANTWEFKTITIAGDTTGTWATDTTAGLILTFSLGTGSTSSAAAGAWAAGAFANATGTVNLVGTNAATFYITGVQLEAGSAATPFERRQYGTELALTQRYYEVSGFYDTFSSDTTGTGLYYNTVRFVVVKRAAPTVTTADAGSLRFSAANPTVLTVAAEGFEVSRTASSSGPAFFRYNWTANAEL